MPPPPDDDERCMRRLQAGDRTALDDLFRLHGTFVLRTCRRILRNSSDSEECCNDVFLKVWHGRDQFTPSKGMFMGWLYGIAKNCALERSRTNHRRREISAGMRADLPQPAPDEVSPEEVVGVNEVLDKAGMSPEQRQSVEQMLEGETNGGAAINLGVPKSTHQSRLEKGLQKVAPLLRPEESR